MSNEDVREVVRCHQRWSVFRNRMAAWLRWPLGPISVAASPRNQRSPRKTIPHRLGSFPSFAVPRGGQAIKGIFASSAVLKGANRIGRLQARSETISSRLPVRPAAVLRTRAWCIVLIFACEFASTAAMAGKDSVDLCANQTASPRARIDYCTSYLQLRTELPENRAIAFYNRGNA